MTQPSWTTVASNYTINTCIYIHVNTHSDIYTCIYMYVQTCFLLRDTKIGKQFKSTYRVREPETSELQYMVAHAVILTFQRLKEKGYKFKMKGRKKRKKEAGKERRRETDLRKMVIYMS